jgi:hypothetical protein
MRYSIVGPPLHEKCLWLKNSLSNVRFSRFGNSWPDGAPAMEPCSYLSTLLTPLPAP